MRCLISLRSDQVQHSDQVQYLEEVCERNARDFKEVINQKLTYTYKNDGDYYLFCSYSNGVNLPNSHGNFTNVMEMAPTRVYKRGSISNDAFSSKVAAFRLVIAASIVC
mmetsp:Transcript_3950/g.5988  ORF Transcript_3950/g.5988 Transcript_3950/m.5988 type:complete len:109 (-) Transcript_3950:8-334(-)